MGTDASLFSLFLYEEERFAGIVVDLPGDGGTIMIKSMAMCGAGL